MRLTKHLAIELNTKLSEVAYDFLEWYNITHCDKIDFRIDGLQEALEFKSIGACNDTSLILYDKQNKKLIEIL